MRFEEIYHNYRQERLNCEAATELPESSVRTFYRMRRRYEEEGMEGLLEK